jgi:hypothetical protein
VNSTGILRVVPVALLAVACTATPPPSTPVAVPLSPALTSPVHATDFVTPRPSSFRFRFDVHNEATIPVIVSVASDAGATLPGFEPGDRGSIVIPLLNPLDGIHVEIQAGGCFLLASANLPTPDPFVLTIEDGIGRTVTLRVNGEVSPEPIPLPSKGLVGCSG